MGKISKAKEKWYKSTEHFNTEKSYEEHLEEVKEKLLQKKMLGVPSLKQLMRM